MNDDILKKIRHIQIATKRILSGSMIGDSRSAFKGSGYEFDQIREFQLGDDVRYIDWKSSARLQKLLMKQYIEERSRTIILAIDVSSSAFFSSADSSRWESFQKIASVLSLVAEYSKDQVSLILFSDKIDFFIPPGKGHSHVYLIMNKIFEWKRKKSHTSFTPVLRHLAQMNRRDGVVFLISDFLVEKQESLFAVIARMYDIIAIRSLDKYEKVIPSVGFLPVEDVETGESFLLDTRGRNNISLQKYLEYRLEDQNKFFKKYRIDCFDINNPKTLISDIICFFRRRMMY